MILNQLGHFPLGRNDRFLATNFTGFGLIALFLTAFIVLVVFCVLALTARAPPLRPATRTVAAPEHAVRGGLGLDPRLGEIAGIASRTVTLFPDEYGINQINAPGPLDSNGSLRPLVVSDRK